MKKMMVMLLSVIMITSIFMVGCTSKESSGGGEGSSDAGYSGKTYKWVAQSPWPSGTTLHWMAEEIARDITAATGGRLEVEMHPAGSIVAAFDILDAVDTGTLDAIHSWEGYWVGQIQAAGFFASMPLGMNEQQYMTWVLQDEGTELWKETFADYNVEVLPAGAYTPEVFYHSTVPIQNLDDLKDLRVRGSAFWGEIQSRLGANVINVPGGEVYQALERGMVDAAEFATPTDNWGLGFHEVAEYLVVPGAHQPTSTFSFMVNQQRWDELPDDLKEIVMLVTENMWGKAWSYAAYQDMQTMEKYRELEEQGKLTIIEFDEGDQVRMSEVTNEYYAELAEKDEQFRKVWESQNKFLEKYNYWRDFMSPSY
ncbi:TRAP transporter substrate-binding protein [Alkalihalobacterium elongatum]|uniref:TRAP transporter substrate-binding protein n=1 Tax=Alkalihalobacterium elongatum TaxID=2675466 RepID=UPI001C1F5A28|nr:TRAP transporter substrate-binding protein DctP [Alkalihalobacterium elongatum]